MKKKLFIIDNKYNESVNCNMYLLQGSKNRNKCTWISETQLAALMKDKEVILVNDTDDTIYIKFVDIEEFDEGYDINTFKYSIKYDSEEMEYIEIDSKTYRREKMAYNYYNKLIKKGYTK